MGTLMSLMREHKHPLHHANDEPIGCWSVWRHGANSAPEMIEGDLPEEIARQMVADYAAEGETVWMEQTPAD